MAVVLRCRDWMGREVILTEECWEGKILRDHVILRGLDWCVQVVLEDPYRVRSDALNPGRECLYRHRTLPAMPDKLLKVVVEYRASGPDGVVVGSVVTAYPTDRFKDGERQIWPAS